MTLCYVTLHTSSHTHTHTNRSTVTGNFWGRSMLDISASWLYNDQCHKYKSYCCHCCCQCDWLPWLMLYTLASSIVVLNLSICFHQLLSSLLLKRPITIFPTNTADSPPPLCVAPPLRPQEAHASLQAPEVVALRHLSRIFEDFWHQKLKAWKTRVSCEMCFFVCFLVIGV